MFWFWIIRKGLLSISQVRELGLSAVLLEYAVAGGGSSSSIYIPVRPSTNKELVWAKRSDDIDNVVALQARSQVSEDLS